MKLFNKKSNKGFSLVELIIVIAIMAILVGIVGTQVIPYIEKSRVGKDQQVMSSLLTDGTTAFATCADKLSPGANYTATITTAAPLQVTCTDASDTVGTTAVKDELENVNTSLKTAKLKDLGFCSKASSGMSSLTIEYDATNEKITVTLNGADQSKLAPITN